MKRFTSVSWSVLGSSAVLALLLAAPACGRNHDDLALRERATGGAAGSGGLGGTGGSSGRGRGGAGAGGTSSGGSGGKFVEPRGRSVTTFFHGIVDAGRTVFCFARHADGEPVLVGNPRPSGGLEYAASFSVETLRGIDLANEAVLPYVIAGDLDIIANMNCEDAVEQAKDEMAAVGALPLGTGGAPGAGGESGSGGGAGEPPVPPSLRVTSLPEIPAGALSEGFSSLYVALGCLGGPAFTHELDEEACGSSYAPDSPTASAVLVTLARVPSFDKLVFQALNASLASPALAVLSAPPDTAVQASVPIVYDVRRGSLLPRRPSPALSAADYGIASPGWMAQASRDGTIILSEPWPDVLERAGMAALLDSRSYTLVVVGPRADIGSEGFWNPGAIGVVDSDPEP